MWVWSHDHTAMVNTDHCFLIIIRHHENPDLGDEWTISVHKDRGDMGTCIKVVNSQEEAESFCNSLGAAANANGNAAAHSPRLLS